MQLKATVTVTPTVKTIECPMVVIDQWGNSAVSYQPMQIVSFSATLPTEQSVPSTYNPTPITWLGEAGCGWDGHGGAR